MGTAAFSQTGPAARELLLDRGPMMAATWSDWIRRLAPLLASTLSDLLSTTSSSTLRPSTSGRAAWAWSYRARNCLAVGLAAPARWKWAVKAKPSTAGPPIFKTSGAWAPSPLSRGILSPSSRAWRATRASSV